MSFSSLWQLVKHSLKSEMKRGTRSSKRSHALRNRRKWGGRLLLEVLDFPFQFGTVLWRSHRGEIPCCPAVWAFVRVIVWRGSSSIGIGRPSCPAARLLLFHNSSQP